MSSTIIEKKLTQTFLLGFGGLWTFVDGLCVMISAFITVADDNDFWDH